MEAFQFYNQPDILALTNIREGEVKLGQRVQVLSDPELLKFTNAKFVLIGIPEDIGVRANLGIPGAATSWQPALKALLNTQSTASLTGEELLVLGYFNFAEPRNTTPEGLQEAVSEIDTQVYPLIQKIVSAGKVPIVIGGGHNNAYPIIKGVSKALEAPLDVLNIDAHADLRPCTGRHSGNGFSYAIQEEFLQQYSIFGLHKNYNNIAILDTINGNPDINAVFFDDLLRDNTELISSCKQLTEHFGKACGLEIDMDCIENILSSAYTPSGFNLNDIRRIILNSTLKFAYMHVCEGAVALEDGRSSQGTAKAIAYLITDFIRAQR